jgi:hypothetical protein
MLYPNVDFYSGIVSTATGCGSINGFLDISPDGRQG